MKSAGIGVAFLLLLSAGICWGQTPDPNNSANSKPAPAAQNAPATQNASGPNGAAQTAPVQGAPAQAGVAKTDASATASEKKKPKKVWTNDEISSVRSSGGGVSVVGDGRSSRPTYGSASTDSDDERQVQIENYRDQIQQIRSEIDAVDNRIAQLKNFKADNSSPSGGINISHGYNMVPVEDQVKQLEERKKKLEAKIEDVEDQARKNGIDPGELR